MKPEMVKIPILRDPYGAIGVVEGADVLPFSVRRFYFIRDVAQGATRGSHAHRSLEQLIVALSGSVVIDLDDGETTREHVLDDASVALLVPPGYWRTLRNFALGTVVGVLASQEYDEADYIRSYRDFLRWKREQ